MNGVPILDVKEVGALSEYSCFFVGLDAKTLTQVRTACTSFEFVIWSRCRVHFLQDNFLRDDFLWDNS